MSKVKITLISEGVRALLRSPEMQAATNSLANGIMQRAGSEGYELSDHVGKNRCNTSVVAVTSKSIRDNEQNNTLLKSLR